jgi:8-oxo-dGTP diphosphatase
MSDSVTSSRPLQADGKVHGVVIACPRRPDQPQDGRWLCIRRSATVAAPLKVCFPGGAMETGESQISAVVREMAEEVGADIRPIKQIWRWEHPEGKLILWGWLAELLTKNLRADPKEVAEILWLSSDEAANHPDAMPSNRSFVAALAQSRL